MPVNAGDTIGFFVWSADSWKGAGYLQISNFSAPTNLPEPSSISLFVLGAAGLLVSRLKRRTQ
jgi:hypothetical protein